MSIDTEIDEILKRWRTEILTAYQNNSLENGTMYFSTSHEGIREQIKDLFDDQEEKLHKIKQWCEAYPLDIFPEPDFKLARKALKEYGITIDAVSASNMRHVLTGIQRIIDE